MPESLDYKSKWNNYKIGKIPWVNSIREHSHRKRFVDYVIGKQDITKILEMGAGEAIEAQAIISKKQNVDYTIIDVSDTFLEHAKSLNIKAFEMNMTKTMFKDKYFDLVYTSCVLEHSPNISKTIKEMCRVSDLFYITLFKWRFKTGDLESDFQSRKSYFSTEFNIFLLLQEIEKYGIIDSMTICTKDGKYVDYFSYLKDCKGMDLHRNGNYLSIIGEWKDGITL